jgi:outer membrane protein TolC
MMFLATLALLTVSPQGPDSTITLAAAAARALAVHPAMAAADAAVATAEARRREARSPWFPQLTTQSSISRFQEPMVVRPIHALDPAHLAFDRTLIQSDLRLSYTLFDGGARLARGRAAGAAVAGSAAGRDAATGDLLADVARRYLAAQTAGETLDAQREGVRALSAERDRVAQLVQQGAGAPVELYRVEAALAQARAELTQAAETLDVTRRALARTLDLPTVTVAEVQPVALTPSDTADRAGLLARVTAQNPELTQAAQAREQARQLRRQAKAAWFPRLDAFGAVNAYGDGSWDFTTEWQVGARVFYSLFAGGQRSATVAQATAAEDAADARYRAAQETIADALDQALASLVQADARVVALEATSRYAAEVARIERLSLDAGAGTEVEYLRAEADLRHARAQRAEARSARMFAHIELARLAGDLTADWLADHTETLP